MADATTTPPKPAAEAPAEMYERLRQEGLSPEKILKRLKGEMAKSGEAIGDVDKMVLESAERGVPLRNAIRVAKNVKRLKTAEVLGSVADVALEGTIGVFDYATAHDDRERVEARAGAELRTAGCVAAATPVVALGAFVTGITGGTLAPLVVPLTAIGAGAACLYGRSKADEHREQLANVYIGSSRLGDEIKDYNYVVDVADAERIRGKLSSETQTALDAEKQILGKLTDKAVLRHEIGSDTGAEVDKSIEKGTKVKTREIIR